MKKLSRSEVEDALINDDINTIEEMIYKGDTSYLRNILYHYYSGTKKASNKILAEEYKERFSESIKITKDTVE